MSISAFRAFHWRVSAIRSNHLVGNSRSIHIQHTSREIQQSRIGDDNQVRMNHVLSAYPIFNLNTEKRPLGPQKEDEAILTLSGGVDSSMAAYLALTKGGLIPHRTIFMRNWNSLDEAESFQPGAGGAEGCQWMRDWNRVEAMASWLDVKPELVDLSIPYWNSVFAPALDDWQIGKTPNPDVACNREIKFGELLRLIDAEEQRSSTSFGRYKSRRWLVTGHYAHVGYYYPPQQDSLLHGRLLRAKDANKDQSYFLSGVSSVHLGRSHFPLANVQKDDVRAAARALGMPTAESEESMGLCFVGKRNKRQEDQLSEPIQKGKGPIATQLGFAGFLGDYIDRKPGPILTLEGKQVGTHSGLHTLTVGQRARVGGAQQKYFVAAKDTKSNGVIVVPGSDHPMLQCTCLDIDDFHVVSFATYNSTGTLYAQIRHRQDPIACHIEERGDCIRVHFDQPVSSVAEGQVCALYDVNNIECLGSGVITAVQTLASSKIL